MGGGDVGGGGDDGGGDKIKMTMMIPSGLTSVPLNLHTEVQVLILDYNQVYIAQDKDDGDIHNGKPVNASFASPK